MKNCLKRRRPALNRHQGRKAIKRAIPFRVLARLGGGRPFEVGGCGIGRPIAGCHGRRPNMEAWRATGIAQTERGWLKVDPATLEARAGVVAAGAVTGLGGFTHLAYCHGEVVARRLRGMDVRADHTAVPRVTFTDPEIASVGLSEAAARERGIDVVVATADPAETA